MVVDIQKLFNEALPAKFASDPSKATALGGKFQINVTGEGGGEWFIDGSDSGPRVERGSGGAADVTITIDAADFQKLYENPKSNAMPLFFSGKLKVAGNQMLAMKLPSIFE